MRNPIKEAWAVSSNPGSARRRIATRVLDDDLSWYLVGLVLAAVAGALFQIAWAIGYAGVVAMRGAVAVDWTRLFNYAFSLGAGAFFIVLFSGTVALFALALIIHVSLRIKLARVLHALVLAAAPGVLFAWLPVASIGVACWCGVLAIGTLRAAKRPDHEVLSRE